MLKNSKELILGDERVIILSKDSRFVYKCDNTSKSRIIYNDATLSLGGYLRQKEFIVSEKDSQPPAFKEAIS